MKVPGTPYEVVQMETGVYRIVRETRHESGVFILVPIAPERYPTRATATAAARKLART